jgi:HEAT repeat protein
LPESPDRAELLAGLRAAERTERQRACVQALARLRDDPDLLDSLQALLRDEDARARFAAAFVLFQSGRASLRLLPALLEALDLEDGDQRWSAAHMLAALGRLHGEILPVLLHLAREAASARQRRMALYVLRELAPERPETQSTLITALDDADPDVRRAALSSLAKLREPDSGALLRALAALRADPDPRMRRIAAVVLPDLLGHHPACRADGIEALDGAIRSSDHALVRAARAALERLRADR